MKDKYKDTIFENDFTIPEKKQNSKNYFFRFPVKEIGYISFNNLLLLIVYYSISFLFFSLLYDKHFVFATVLILLNVLFGLILVLKDRYTGKNSLDMIFIMYKFLKGKNIGIFKGKKQDFFSLNQK